MCTEYICSMYICVCMYVAGPYNRGGRGGGMPPPPTLFHQDENLEEPGQQQPGPVGM